MMSLLVLLALAATPPDDVTKEDVKKMVEVGVSDGVILDVLRSRRPMSPLTADDLVDLRNAQVSDAVVTAMIESSQRPAPAEPQTIVEMYPYGYYAPPSWWYFGVSLGGWYYYPCYPRYCVAPSRFGYRYALPATAPKTGSSWAPVSTSSSSSSARPAPSSPSSGPRSGLRR